MKLLVSIDALVFMCSVSLADELPNVPFLYSSGEVSVEVQPDFVLISFTIEASHKSSKKAIIAVNERSIEMFNLFKNFKIDPKDIRAYDFGKSAITSDDDENEGMIVGYQIEREFEITLRDLKRYVKLIGTLLATENVTDIESNFQTTKRV